MRFCTVINCIDGRVQLPVMIYLQAWFEVEYVDTITESGPNLILSDQEKTVNIQSILERLIISIEKHNSAGIAVVGHYDCAGNPAPREIQTGHLEKSVAFIRQHIKEVEIIGLWVDAEFEVQKVV